MEKGTPTGVPWYSEAEFVALRAMLPASERKDPISYESFVSKIEQMEKAAQQRGCITRRIPIHAAAVKAWCDEKKLPVCRDSIAKYGMEQVARGVLESGNN
jgi:hypothetical protein